MKRSKISYVTAAMLFVAGTAFTSIGVLAKDGTSGDDSSQASSTQVETHPSTDTSSKASTDSSTIQKVEVTNDDKAGEVENELSDDSSQQTVVLGEKNGKTVALTKKGETVEKETELSDKSSLSITKTDAAGRKHLVKVKAQGDHFVIQDGSAEAAAHFPLVVDQATNTLSVVIPAGIVAVRVLPEQAIEAIMEIKKIDTVESAEVEVDGKAEDGGITVTDNTATTRKAPSTTVVSFKITGTKHVKLLDLVPVDATVTSLVDAKTGNVTVLGQSWFLNLLGFLFSSK